METLLLTAFVVVAVALIGLVLIQHGKGADAGAAFGSGASATVFGSSGSGNFLSRTTGILAAIFFAISLALANLSGKTSREASVTEKVAPAVEEPATAPVIDVPADVPAAPAVSTETTDNTRPAADVPVPAESSKTDEAADKPE